ncbi:Segmentation fushi tarazu [Gossypium arboreum]|uniref:Segmentation fushi tarazu n=1 Tax=Gossypium arboreum TaxID=29729 RepID=A0A0B0NN03_GOSAR|nr:Segmentation fushi tarazu [Gossypium arboreum]
MTSEVGEIMEKLKEKKTEYEAIASTDSSVNLENIDNRIIIEVLSPESVTPTQYFGSGSKQYMPSGSQAQAEVQGLRDQIAQMQASTVEQIAEVQLRAEAVEREAAAAAMAVKQSRKYDEVQLQL